MAAKHKKTMHIKLLIHKQTSKLVFAECEKDFIDVLFSFFTLPIATIIKLTHKNPVLGCMNSLYASLEALNNGYFETQACKSMLLDPKTASEFLCQNLEVNLDGIVPKVYYLCSNWVCSTEIKRLASVFENVRCSCGRVMSKATDFVGKKSDVFVKGVDKFVVFDDLRVIMVPRETGLGLDDIFELPEERLGFEERIVDVGLDEVLQLLTCSLASTHPMTDVFLLSKKDELGGFLSETPEITMPSPCVQPVSKSITVKLWVRKSTNKVLFAEVKEDFLDILFGFLAFPLGYAVKVIGPHSNLGSMHKLYKSVEVLSAEYPEDFTENMDHLLDPQIAHHYGCQNQLIDIKEATWETEHLKCFTCFNRKLNYCYHWLGHTDIHLINPKVTCTDTSQGGGFIKKAHVFMIMDNLVVNPFSWIAWISVIHNMGVPYNDVEERSAEVGEQEVLCVFKSALTGSKTALSDAFCKGQ